MRKIKLKEQAKKQKEAINKEVIRLHNKANTLRKSPFTGEQLAKHLNFLLKKEQLAMSKLFGDTFKAMEAAKKVTQPIKLQQDVTEGHGIRSYIDRHKLKDVFEFAEHYLKHQEPHNFDYVVNGYSDVSALAASVGIQPKTLFDDLCKIIKQRQTRLKKNKLTQNFYAVCELVDHYDKNQKKSTRYSVSQLAKSKYFKDWCIRHDVDFGSTSKKPENRLLEIWPVFIKIADAKMMQYEKTVAEVEADFAYHELENSYKK